jgi:hypothetical protein
VNLSVNRTFDLGTRRSFGLSVNVQNLLNRQHYNNPTLDPTNTNFGQIRTVNNSLMRFITFDAKFNF